MLFATTREYSCFGLPAISNEITFGLLIGYTLSVLLCQSHTNNLQPTECQGETGGEGGRVIECGGFYVHEAGLFIPTVKQAQKLLFGDE